MEVILEVWSFQRKTSWTRHKHTYYFYHIIIIIIIIITIIIITIIIIIIIITIIIIIIIIIIIKKSKNKIPLSSKCKVLQIRSHEKRIKQKPNQNTWLDGNI